MPEGRNQRRKGRRVHAVSAPVRRRPDAAAVPARAVHLADPGEALAYAYAYRPVARALESAGAKPKHTTRSLRSWITDARKALATTPEGREELKRINLVFATAGAELVDLGPRACGEMQDVAVDAAIIFVRTIRRYDVTDAEELELAKAYAMNLAIAKAARARLFGVGFATLSATRVGTLSDGAKLTSRLPAGADLASIAREHDREARIALLTLRDLVAERARTGAPRLDPALAERLKKIQEDRERRAALAAEHVDEDDDEDEDEQPEPDQRELHDRAPAVAPAAPSHEATLVRLQREAPRATGYRPTPTANVVPPSEPLERWLPSVLAPWAPKFQGLGHMALTGRIGAVLQRVGALQVAGEFGRREAEIIGAVTAWRNRVMALGHFEGEAP